MGAPDSVVEMLSEARKAAWDGLGEAGDWLTAQQRRQVWIEARATASDPLDRARLDALSPAAVEGRHGAAGPLSSEAVEVVHRVASDPGRLTQVWANEMIDALGEETYTELVGITAIVTMLDRFALASGEPQPDLPELQAGEPARSRPGGVGDVGAWVSQQIDNPRANVSRALSLVPETNQSWRLLVDAHYSRGTDFFELVWDRALSRPQVELVAARTTAMNECFY